jgi:hypothetical protein
MAVLSPGQGFNTEYHSRPTLSTHEPLSQAFCGKIYLFSATTVNGSHSCERVLSRVTSPQWCHQAIFIVVTSIEEKAYHMVSAKLCNTFISLCMWYRKMLTFVTEKYFLSISEPIKSIKCIATVMMKSMIYDHSIQFHVHLDKAFTIWSICNRW